MYRKHFHVVVAPPRGMDWFCRRLQQSVEKVALPVGANGAGRPTSGRLAAMGRA